MLIKNSIEEQRQMRDNLAKDREAAAAERKEREAQRKAAEGMRKEIERLRDLLDRVVEDNAGLRASNKALRSKVNRLQIRLRGELPGDPCAGPVTGDDSWMFDMDDSW